MWIQKNMYSLSWLQQGFQRGRVPRKVCGAVHGKAFKQWDVWGKLYQEKVLIERYLGTAFNAVHKGVRFPM